MVLQVRIGRKDWSKMAGLGWKSAARISLTGCVVDTLEKI